MGMCSRVFVAEPSVIQYEKLHAKIRCRSSELQKSFRIEIAKDRFPTIEQNRSRFIDEFGPAKVVPI